MKYISRITALLLVLMMLTPTFASALTLENATQSDLDIMYQAVAGYSYLEDSLGFKTAIFFEGADKLAAKGYTFQWYEILEDAPDREIVGATNYSYPTEFTLDPKQYYCIYADSDGIEYMSNIFVVAASATDMELYLDTLFSLFNDDFGVFDTLKIYEYMTDTWNVQLSTGENLAKKVMDYWWADWSAENGDCDMLCTCVVSGKVENEYVILHPSSGAHDSNCYWAKDPITASSDVSTPDKLQEGQTIVLTTPDEHASYFYWQAYRYNTETDVWEWETVSGGSSYELTANIDTIQAAYRVISNYEDGMYVIPVESRMFFLGGEDFHNWIMSANGILPWLSDDGVTVDQVVAKYNEFLKNKDEEDRTNAEDYTYGEEGESVNLKVPQGAFAEDYVMEFAEVAAERVAQLQNAVMAQMDATGTHAAQVLMALDISFASLADRANKLQPNAPVALTFEVDTTGLDEALKYLYVYHIANDGTPEVVAGPFDAAQQEIQVEAEAFSEYLVMATSDECVYCQNMGMCFYDMLADMTHEEQYAYLQTLNGSYVSYMQDYARHVAAGAPAILCTCVNYANGERPNEPMDGTHGTTCPWSDNAVQWIGVLGSPVTLKLETGAYKAYEWYLGNTNGTPIGYESTYSTTYTKDAKLYVLKTQDDNNAWSEHWFRVQADMTIMYEYLSYVGDNAFWMESGDRDRQAIYDIMTTTWNVAIDDNADNILAKAILVYWKYNMYAGEEDIFCSCCIGEGDIVSDQIMLHPDAVHTDPACPWRQCKPGLNLACRDDGALYYELMLTDANGELVTVAVSAMLDEKYHYFQDVNTGWYVAYLHEVTNEDGTVTQWIIPLPSEKDLEEIPAN